MHLWGWMNQEGKCFSCAADTLMWNWDSETLCSASVVPRGAFLSGSSEPKLIEITPAGSFNSNSLPHVWGASFSPSLLKQSFQMLLSKGLKYNSGEVNVQSRLVALSSETAGSRGSQWWVSREFKHTWETHKLNLNTDHTERWKLFLSPYSHFLIDAELLWSSSSSWFLGCMDLVPDLSGVYPWVGG